MVQELEGTEITIVPATVGKITPDGTPEQEMEVGSRRHAGKSTVTR